GFAGCVAGPGGTLVLDLSGTPLSRAPKWNAVMGFVSQIPVGSNLVIGLNGDMNYSSSYLTQEDGNPNAIQDTFIKVNAGISLGSRDEKWKVSLIGRNLTNEYIVLYSTSKPASVAVAGQGPDIGGWVDRGRQVSFQASFAF